MKYWLIGVGVVLGVVGSLAFNVTMSVTSHEQFCVSCHEMTIPEQRLAQTTHGKNTHGIVVECGDCHIPKEMVPKLWRKISASREVVGHLMGTLDTPEKYAAHRDAMHEREWTRMKASDSAECRHCHSPERWVAESHSRAAQLDHARMGQEDVTCIDCHKGIGHPIEVAAESSEDLFGF
jgi:cytochrome c-type protein NapC